MQYKRNFDSQEQGGGKRTIAERENSRRPGMRVEKTKQKDLLMTETSHVAVGQSVSLESQHTMRNMKAESSLPYASNWCLISKVTQVFI